MLDNKYFVLMVMNFIPRRIHYAGLTWYFAILYYPTDDMIADINKVAARSDSHMLLNNNVLKSI